MDRPFNVYDLIELAIAEVLEKVLPTFSEAERSSVSSYVYSALAEVIDPQERKLWQAMLAIAPGRLRELDDTELPEAARRVAREADALLRAYDEVIDHLRDH